MKKEHLNYFFVFLIGVFLLSFILAVSPYGASDVEVVNSSTAPLDDPQSLPAQAGNVTEVNIFGYTTTQSWQGYFGNVSGTIQLADSSDNVFYNWSVANPKGEIYASTADNVNWSSISCFNFTTDGLALESTYGIESDDVDGVNETFSIANGHDLFYTNNIEFSSGQCMSTQLFDSTGGSTVGIFEEVLLWDGDAVIFTSIIENASVSGFDNKDHDFEMLVLEDGHLDDTSTTPYYFYVELQ